MRGKGLLARIIVELFKLFFILPLALLGAVLSGFFRLVTLPFSAPRRGRKKKQGTRGTGSSRSSGKVIHRATIEIQLPVDEGELEQKLTDSGVIEKVVDEVMAKLDLPALSETRTNSEDKGRRKGKQ